MALTDIALRNAKATRLYAYVVFPVNCSGASSIWSSTCEDDTCSVLIAKQNRQGQLKGQVRPQSLRVG